MDHQREENTIIKISLVTGLMWQVCPKLRSLQTPSNPATAVTGKSSRFISVNVSRSLPWDRAADQPSSVYVHSQPMLCRQLHKKTGKAKQRQQQNSWKKGCHHDSTAYLSSSLHPAWWLMGLQLLRSSTSCVPSQPKWATQCSTSALKTSTQGHSPFT